MSVRVAGVACLCLAAVISSSARADDNAESDFFESRDRTFHPNWNEYDLKYFTFKWGIYTILDFGNAAQSDESRAQVDVPRDNKIRDFRFSFKGKFATERPITYTMGLMYDGPTNSWFPRETGIQVGLPELWGSIFFGRQKEGISLNKITVGYVGWTMERMPMSDATIPILADGIKWLGVLPNKRANFNIAVFHNALPENPSKGWYDNAFVARLAVLPVRPDQGDAGALLHLGVGYHWGKYSDGQAQLDSRPGSSTAPVFVDTGVFPAEEDHLVGLEAYFRYHSVMVGGEYLLDFIRAPEVGDPLLHGGEAFITWIVTGETRPYIDVGGKVDFFKVASSAFEGGTGALETVLHFSYTDLDGGAVRGGKFWRLTPQLNWFLDDMVSLRVNYGLGSLDRFGSEELTHFFQARLQLQIQ